MSHEPLQAGPGVILTPDQRIRVFISSTLEELASERVAARRAIQRLRLVPVWYESGARPHPPRSMYRAYLEQSQVFVGIYWQRYGWVGPGMEISGLEDEYRLAAGKPMLLYLKRPAPDQEPRLTALIDSIRAAGTMSYRTFATPRELERLLVDDLAVVLSESFRGAAEGTAAPRRSSAGPGEPGEAELPAGTVTFAFTDIEDSARLWETEPAAMARGLVLHNETLHAAFGHHGGVVFSTMGDEMAVAFSSAAGAVRASVEAQRALTAAPWPAETGVLKVRMGLHTDEVALSDGQYAAAPLRRCARLMAAAHGGQILMSDATEALVRSQLPDGATVLDLGEHRLRDLAGRVHIFQLVHPDFPGAFPALRTPDAFPGNLPLQVSSFIGRARELEQTAAALGEARVVTLIGVGGVGKTRLALQVAGQVLPRFGDGAWLCELAPIRDAAGVDGAVAAVFSVAARGSQSTRDALVEFLRNKELLLVLDNCEHLLAGAAALAAVLERSCARLVILATSREGLGIDGERLVPVPPFEAPDADADLETITDAEAVRLFADRASAVKPGFMVTRRERGGGRGGGPAPGWGGAGHRAGGGAGARDDPGRAGPPPGPAFRGARGWPAGRGGTSPDAAGRDRLVLRAAHRARAAAAGPAGGVRGRLHPAGRRGGLQWRGYRSRRGVRAAGEPGGAFAGGGRGIRAAEPLPVAGDDPPVRRGAP